jgi:hypothetical protein
MLGFVQIPLEIAKSIVAVPASIVSVKVGDLSQQQTLVKAQQQLYLMQQAYLQALSGATPAAVPGTVPTPTVPAGIDPSRFSIPSDLVPLTRPDDPFGYDLFKVALKTVCNGGSS